MTNIDQVAIAEEVPIIDQYNELLEMANKDFPDLLESIGSYTSYKVEMKNYQDYFNLLNEPPSVVATNSAT
ncbi:MAG TPA: hypothetical protein PKM58_03935 [Pyrinomonadaceae bacterium]|nr:hypothetical protein [Pyrinomonadaceae bacterium]